jgi:hypothetical protein
MSKQGIPVGGSRKLGPILFLKALKHRTLLMECAKGVEIMR